MECVVRRKASYFEIRTTRARSVAIRAELDRFSPFACMCVCRCAWHGLESLVCLNSNVLKVYLVVVPLKVDVCCVASRGTDEVATTRCWPLVEKRSPGECQAVCVVLAVADRTGVGEWRVHCISRGAGAEVGHLLPQVPISLRLVPIISNRNGVSLCLVILVIGIIYFNTECVSRWVIAGTLVNHHWQ